MKIYTKSGDKGETGLFGGRRVSKNDLRIEAYGTIDELNGILGVTICELNDDEISDTLFNIQNELFTAGADLAAPEEYENKKFIIPRIEKSHVEKIEKLIDKFNSKLPELKEFILPGGAKGAAFLHYARTVCRRAERNVVALSIKENIGTEIIKYINRLSDLLFVLARYENHRSSSPDVKWQK